MSRAFFILLLCFCLSAQSALADPVDDRVDALLARMTLDEKIGQLNQLSADTVDHATLLKMLREGRVGSLLNVAVYARKTHTADGASKKGTDAQVADAQLYNDLQKVAVEQSRLHIPLLEAHDVIHGLRTIFPVPLAEAASFHPLLAYQTASVAAREARAIGIRWTFAPMVDVARDPRWGRIVEGSGEDPCLGQEFASWRTLGYQLSLTESPVLATAKHFAAYGAAEGGRDYNSVDISERTLREIYLPPFKAAADRHVGAFMAAFNDIAGVPCSASPFLLHRVLRDEWHYKGIVVSDWQSIGELVNHGVVATLKDAAALAMNAGVDVDMQAGAYSAHLAELVKSGVVSEQRVDDAVRRVLRAKVRLGLFEHPYVDVANVPAAMLSSEHLELARKAGRESIVLLKNDHNVLPLHKDLRTIAVIGPLADDHASMLGSWICAGEAADCVTLREGITKALPQTRVLYARGCDVTGTDRAGFAAALQAARQADAVILMLGERGDMTGEAQSRASLDIPGVQSDLAMQILQTGKPVVLVLANGRPLTLGPLADKAPAIVETWYLGVQAGNAIADVLFGDYNPAGRLPITWPRSVGQIPIYYNHRNTGRPAISKYKDIDNTPQYPFGWGLSYTSFRYANLRIAANKWKQYDGTLVSMQGAAFITVDVTNTGSRDGEEVVQLYIRDTVASTSRPVLQLAEFNRVPVKKGGTITVQFNLQDLQQLDGNSKREAPAHFEVWVGSHAGSGVKGAFDSTW